MRSQAVISDGIARATAGTYSGLNLNWTYDSFGNRLTQGVSGTTGPSVPSPQILTYNADNQIVGYSYDADGNVTDESLRY